MQCLNAQLPSIVITREKFAAISEISLSIFRATGSFIERL